LYSLLSLTLSASIERLSILSIGKRVIVVSSREARERAKEREREEMERARER